MQFTLSRWAQAFFSAAAGWIAADRRAGLRNFPEALLDRLILLPGLFILLAHAVIPMDEFIHRGDDAFYYFQVACNHVRYGFWTFDGIHPTNGVQPLWALILTVLAHVVSWFGPLDPEGFARIAVALTGAIYFAACLVLHAILRAQTSRGVALAAAGALLYPLGAVWGRVWGMETPLYLLTLFSALAFYRFSFLPAPSYRKAVGLGLLLALCVFGRLNAVFFIACLLAFYLLWAGGARPLTRFKFVLAAGFTASAMILVYLAMNYLGAGHLTPISGAVKIVRSAHALEDFGARSFFDVVEMVRARWTEGLKWFVSSRVGDGFWIAGLRLVADQAIGVKEALALLFATAAAPLLLGRPREWLDTLLGAARRLSVFSVFAAYAVMDAVVSILMFPLETYAALRWWLAPLEVTLTVCTVTLLVTAVGYIAARFMTPSYGAVALSAAVLLLGLAHAAQFVRYYWKEHDAQRDWNLSWNDGSYGGALWVNENLQEGVIVGSWNAGIFGYFSERPVVNLDGLINNFDLLSYLKERRVADYIMRENIAYLGDLEPMFKAVRIEKDLSLTEVYRSRPDFSDYDYVIYRVNGPAGGAQERQ